MISLKHEILLSCPPVLRDFLTYNETIRGKSAKTVEEYYLDLQTFFRYLLLVRGKVASDSEFEKEMYHTLKPDYLGTERFWVTGSKTVFMFLRKMRSTWFS